MNERIKELAEQAGATVLTTHGMEDVVDGCYVIGPARLEKFAELIVRQMLDVTDAHTEVFRTDRDKALIEHIKQSVKQHFGVEE